MRALLAVCLAVLLAVALTGAASVLPLAARLALPWDIATLRQPNEIKHRVRAVLSALSAQPPATADMTPIAHTAQQPLGVNTFFEQEVDEATIRRSMAMIRAAGFGWIRQQFAWYEIEIPSRGRYVDSATARSSWEKYDRIVALAAEFDLQILARIDTVPAWARPAGSTFTHPPTDLQAYGDFARTVAERYRGRIRYYQLWNEPNLTFEWGNRNVSASDFTPLLAVGYDGVKAGDPQAVVVAPALAPTIDRGPANRNDTLFLREMYEEGAGNYFDVMSTMAYGLLSGPDDRRVDAFWQVNFSRALLLRQIMVEYGDAHKPIWFSEFAWNALPDSFTDMPLYGRVTEDQQARYTVRGLKRMQEEWPWAGVSFVWFFRRPTDGERDQQFYYFRLVEPDFRVLPVYEAIKAAAPSLRVLARGWHAPTHWAIDASGRWQRETTDDLPTMQATQAGAALSFTYRGTDLAIEAQGPGRVYVNAEGTRLSQTAGGQAFVDIPAESVRIELMRGAALGNHAVTLTLAEGQMAISGVIVDRQAGFPAPLLGAAGVYMAIWAIAWRVRR